MIEPLQAEASLVESLAIDDALTATRRVGRPRKRRRRTRPRSRTLAMKRITRAELRAGALMFPPVNDVVRPRTRGDCSDEARPCPWVSCKHHLYLDVNPETGSIKINFPDVEPWDMRETCALDIAERGGVTLEEVGEIMNLTRERIRQVEVRGLLTLRMASPSADEPGAALVSDRVSQRKALAVSSQERRERRAQSVELATRTLRAEPDATDRSVSYRAFGSVTGSYLETTARIREQLGIPPTRGPGKKPA